MLVMHTVLYCCILLGMKLLLLISVTYNGISSGTKKVNCGVPQGSILGLLLFHIYIYTYIYIYINDFSSICKFTTPVLIADDTNLYSGGTNLQAMASNINYELEQMSLWLKWINCPLMWRKYTTPPTKSFRWLAPVIRMRYLGHQMSLDAEILLDCVRQDHLKGKLVVQTQRMKYTYIHCITRR